MDAHGVGQAAVVCAAIENNPDNVEYVSYARSRYPDRFHVIADLDCTWHETYHRAGSADRMRALSDRYQIAGFTHYLGRDNDGWLAGERPRRCSRRLRSAGCWSAWPQLQRGRRTCGSWRDATQVSRSSAIISAECRLKPRPTQRGYRRSSNRSRARTSTLRPDSITSPLGDGIIPRPTPSSCSGRYSRRSARTGSAGRRLPRIDPTLYLPPVA